MNTPLVSIIIPTFNRAHLIGETLDSIISQTYENWECIVVDDGSSDGTEKVLNQYMELDSRIRYFHRPKEHLPGGSGARNYGIVQSIGNYVNFVDSDDILHENALSVKMGMALKYDVDIVLSETGRKFDVSMNLDDIPYKLFETNSFDIDYLLRRNRYLIGDPLINKLFISEVQFNETLVRGQDHDFLIRLFRQKIRYCTIPLILYKYRITANSITKRAGHGERKMVQAQVYLHKRMQKEYEDFPKVVFEYERKSRKMYKSLILKNKVVLILLNYHFYRKSYHLNNFQFLFYFAYNLLFKKGFDRMKRQIK